MADEARDSRGTRPRGRARWRSRTRPGQDERGEQLACRPGSALRTRCSTSRAPIALRLLDEGGSSGHGRPSGSSCRGRGRGSGSRCPRRARSAARVSAMRARLRRRGVRELPAGAAATPPSPAARRPRRASTSLDRRRATRVRRRARGDRRRQRQAAARSSTRPPQSDDVLEPGALLAREREPVPDLRQPEVHHEPERDREDERDERELLRVAQPVHQRHARRQQRPHRPDHRGLGPVHATGAARALLVARSSGDDGGPAEERRGSVGKRLNVYIVDDSAMQADIARALLEKAGHSVVTYRSGADALRDLPAARPDCILMDIMMPGLDGYELCRRLRAMDELAGTKLVMMSTKAYPFDRARAFAIGADGYFVKPLHPATFVPELERLVADTLVMTFWGVRGTLPVSRLDSVRYGGNTSCVSLSFPDGRLFIFDAGTGIKALSDALTGRQAHPHRRQDPHHAPALGPHQRAAVLRALLRAGEPVRDLRPRARRHHRARPGLGADGRRLLSRHRARVLRQHLLSRPERGRLRDRRRQGPDDAPQPSRQLSRLPAGARRAVDLLRDRQRALLRPTPSSTPRSTSSASPISRAAPTSSSPTAPTWTRSTRGRSAGATRR